MIFSLVKTYWRAEHFKQKIFKKKVKQGEKWKWKFSTTLRTKINFISEESLIFADFKDIIGFWIKTINPSQTGEINMLLEIF